MLRLIGFDIGTTSLSAVVINGENGEILKTITVDNDSFISCNDSFHRMQNPMKIRNKIFEIKQQLVEEFFPIAAIGVTGQMHGVLYLNKNGEPVSPLYTWQDNSGSLPYKNSTYAQFLSEKSGYNLASGYGIVTHYVNKDLNLVPNGAVTFCTIHDYIAMSLVGNNTPIMHTSNAASLGCFSFENCGFDIQKISELGIDIDFLPNITHNSIVLGKDCNNIPVSVAIGDNQASVIGSINSENCALINIGTGSQVSILSKTPCAFLQGEVRPLTQDNYLLVGAPLCGGRSFAILHSFFKECAKLFGGDADNVYRVMNDIACENSDRHMLVVDTRFCGTRIDTSITGSICNITDSNFTPEELVRGFLYGMANELFMLYREMVPLTDITVKSIVGSGNAIRKSPVLKKYIEELFGMKLNIPIHSEEAAFGAALFASVSIGYYDSIVSAQKKLVHHI